LGYLDILLKLLSRAESIGGLRPGLEDEMVEDEDWLHIFAILTFLLCTYNLNSVKAAAVQTARSGHGMRIEASIEMMGGK
jgi:hypothetical protein